MVKKTHKKGSIKVLASRASFVPLEKQFKNQLYEGTRRARTPKGWLFPL
jgi:hypothetical protein